MFQIRQFLQTTLFVFAAASGGAVHSQAYPVKPIKVIVPYSAGGTLDLVARTYAEAVSKSIGQPLIIDNKAGGNTFIGMSECARSQPDGYTLCIINSDALAVGPSAFTKMPYVPTKDLIGISTLAAPIAGIFARANAPFNNYQEMVAYAKANPGKLGYASWGSGTISQLYLELLNQRIKAEMLMVPYRGSANVLQAVLGGETELGYFALGQVLPYIKEGKIKPIVITGSRKAPQLPNTPSGSEVGVDLGVKSEFGVYAPVATPSKIVQMLNSAFVAAGRDPKVQKMLSEQSIETLGTSVDEINKSMKAQLEASRAVYKDFNLKPND